MTYLPYSFRRALDAEPPRGVDNVALTVTRVGRRQGKIDWAVYICRAANGTVLYVGTTGDWNARQREHRRKSAWWPQVVSVEVRLGAGRRDEGLTIHALRPVHNRQGNPDWRWTGKRYERVAA